MGDIREHKLTDHPEYVAQVAREWAEAERAVVRRLHRLHAEIEAVAKEIQAVDCDAADALRHDIGGALIDFKGAYFGHVDMGSAV